MPYCNMAQDACPRVRVYEIRRGIWAAYSTHDYIRMSSHCAYPVQCCIYTICQCECIRSYQAHCSSSLKAFYGCLYGRRAAVTGTGMERGEHAMVQLRKTLVQPWEWSLPWPSFTLAWQGGFALNWVTGEHTHTWNSNKRTCSCYTHTLVYVCMSEWDEIVQATWQK